MKKKEKWYWRVLARFLARPKVREYLIRRARKTPFKHIGDYMDRWWLFNPKWKISWLPAIRIHHIKRPDGDRDKHDHPFSFRSFILWREYWEEDVMGIPRFRGEGTTYYSTAERFHQIIDVPPLGVLTLVICWPKTQPWGFMKAVQNEDGSWRCVKVHHHDYHNTTNMQLIDPNGEDDD